MKMDDLSPPAIVKQDQSEVDQLLFEATAAIELGERCQKQGFDKFILAGSKLLLLRKKIAHGDWGRFIADRVKRSSRQVRRWMRLARTTTDSDMDAAWRIICGHHDAEDETEDGKTDAASVLEPAAGSSANGPIQSRAERTGQKPKKSIIERQPGEGDKAIRRPPSNVGKEKPRWDVIKKPHGMLVRSIDECLKPYKANNTPKVQEIRDRLFACLTELKAIYAEVTKQKAPE